MAQRAALARALGNDPGLLILDEPLGKLDSLIRLQMQTKLVRIWRDRGFTALLVTHDVAEALLLAYPRHRDDPALVRLRRDVPDQLGLTS